MFQSLNKNLTTASWWDRFTAPLRYAVNGPTCKRYVQEINMNTKISGLIFLLIMTGSAAAQDMNQSLMSASFYDMKEEKFSLKAVAPADVIRQYTVCKAVWFSEKKKAKNISLSNPKYSYKYEQLGKMITVPEGWVVLDATAYLLEPNPTGNPFISIEKMAVPCRKNWDWYN